jgi:hypothetical protein
MLGHFSDDFVSLSQWPKLNGADMSGIEQPAIIEDTSKMLDVCPLFSPICDSYQCGQVEAIGLGA